MVKLVYTYASGAYAVRCAGSSPVSGTRDKEARMERYCDVCGVELDSEDEEVSLCKVCQTL